MRRRDFIALLPFAAGLPSTIAAAAEVDDAALRGRPICASTSSATSAPKAMVSPTTGRLSKTPARFWRPAAVARCTFRKAVMSADVGQNITVRNNIEYFGDGERSVIIGNNAALSVQMVLSSGAIPTRITTIIRRATSSPAINRSR